MNLRTLLRSTLALAVTAAATSSFAATVVFRDDFSNQSSGWSHQDIAGNDDKGFAMYNGTGEYQMTPITDNTYGLVPSPKQASGRDVRIESDVFLYSGVGAGAGGIACRSSDMRNFYGFIARGDATLLIVKVKDGKATPLANGKVDQLVPDTVDTHFTVECKGDTLRLKAKDGSTLEARDSELTGTTTGLLVLGEKLAGANAVFDNFVLTDLAK